jgi:hypothetical protein
MAAGTLSPLQLIVGQGLLQNTALGVSPALIAAINRYKATPLMTAFYLADAAYPGLGPAINSPVPAFTDTLPAGYTDLGTKMTATILAQAYIDSGSGDNSKFIQALGLSLSYTQNTNLFIDSAVNSQDYLANTFTSTNDSITGDITTINLATPEFGQDLENLGRLINLSRLDVLGSPLALIQNVVLIIGSVPTLTASLLNQGVPQEVVLNITNPTLSTTDSVQRLMYQAMTQVTGNDLAQILKVLKVTTANITTMADLLNPVKLFPGSFQSLTVSLPAGIRAIYVNASGSVNVGLIQELPPFVVDRYNNLKQIIPADQALANCALGVALLQINGISNMDLRTFAATTKNMETTKSLPALAALETAVPPSVSNFYDSFLAAGTGVNNSVRIVDILGLAGGWIATKNFIETVDIFATMNLSTLTAIYQRMVTAINGGYGPVDSGPINIPPGPGAGSYVGVETDPGPPPVYDPTAIEVAMPALISAAHAECVSLQAQYPAETGRLNELWIEMAAQIRRERYFQTLIRLSWSDLTPNDRVAVYGFVYSLPTYGLQTEEGGLVWLLEQMAQVPTLSAEAVIGCMREGRNTVALNDAGISTNTKVPGEPDPPPPPAELLPSTYSESQAENLAIK